MLSLLLSLLSILLPLSYTRARIPYYDTSSISSTLGFAVILLLRMLNTGIMIIIIITKNCSWYCYENTTSTAMISMIAIAVGIIINITITIVPLITVLYCSDYYHYLVLLLSYYCYYYCCYYYYYYCCYYYYYYCYYY